MFQYKQEISQFIESNFTDSTHEDATVKWTTFQFLQFLFDVFPKDCINDYELDAILKRLGFSKKMYAIEQSIEKKVNGKMIQVVNYIPQLGWCLESHLIPKSKERIVNSE